MIDRQTKKPGRSGERGAALVVAIAIMTILLALALTFYAISRNEVNIADNIQHQVQNDLNLDGVLAKVQSDLNRNFLKYPNATSYDQAPFTTYDGSWVVGKEWGLRNDPTYGRIPLQGIDTDGDLLPDVPGVPLVDLRNQPNITFPDGTVELLFNGPRSRDWLGIPRYEGAVPYAYAPVTGAGFNLFDITQDDNPVGEGLRPPFVTPAFYGPSETRNELASLDPRLEGEVERYPLEWIDTWTDVDNDGDGLKDAIWIPIAQERLFSGGDIVDEATGRRMYADGIDNDLDGMIDENQEDNLDYDGDGNPGGIDPDEQLEIGSFVYYGGDDGLDNDGDGLIDAAADADESFVPPYYGLFLAASLPNLIIPVDLNADGKVPDFVPDDANGGAMTMLTVTLPPTISVRIRSVLTDPTSAIITVDLNDTRVDALDNDYDMLIDDYYVYAHVGPNTLANTLDPPFQFQGVEDSGEVYPPGHPLAGQRVFQAIENESADNSNEDLFTTAKLKSYEFINPAAYPVGLTVYPQTSTFFSGFAGGTITYDFGANLETPGILRITHSGEPVSDLTGRAAITIRDEASRVNINVAGGHNYNPLGNDVFRSLGGGTTTAEVETRNLPDLGVALARNLSDLRFGKPKNFTPLGFEEDTSLPGYARVDDNANALVSAFNGKDDDGDGLIDEGLYLPPLSPMAERFLAGTALPGDNAALAGQELDRTRYREYFNQLGAFEGVDEAAELQRFNPLPNFVAEGNNPYKNSALAIDLLDNDNDGAINERGEVGDLQLQDTLQLTEVNGIGPVTSGSLQPLTSAFSTDRNVNFVGGRDGVRAINKLDYNFATPVQIAGNLLLANPFESVTARPAQFGDATTRAFAEGLRQGDVHIRANFGGLLNGTVGYFAADPVLQAMQAAVDIVDNRDRDHIRSVLTSEKTKLAPSALGGYDYFPDRLSMRERIEDGALMSLGELQDHLRDQMAITRKLEIRDDWWTFEAGVIGISGTNPEVREISYTASGNEAIKINEIMVRAVRRIEAEAVVNALSATDPMGVVPVARLLNFDPTPFDGGGNPNILPQFDVDRETVPAVLTNGWELTDGGFLGETSAMSITLTNTTTVLEASDILEFTVRADEGLPPGRYYLTLNTNSVAGVPTVVPVGAGNPEMLQVAVKYRQPAAAVPLSRTIIGDITDLATPIDFFQAIPDAHVADSIPGAPNGWAFVNGTAGGAGLVAGYHADGLPDDGAILSNEAFAGETFTITVPEAGSSYELRIAVRLNPAYVAAILPILAGTTDQVTVSINSLDFSQEPDHEWLEVVNTSNETVDVGGWEMEVGIPNRPTVPVDPFKSTWTIPQGTQIAPGGMVLLAFSKFDAFRDTVPAAHRIADNGMGLADGEYNSIPALGNLLSDRLTVPSIADNSTGGTVIAPNDLSDPTGSVFRRLAHSLSGLTDYMDADGDGRTAYNAPTATPANANVDNLANDVLIASSTELGTLVTSARGDLPWDRIIQLEPTSIVTRENPFTASPTPQRLLEIGTVADVAAFVLRGGVFPNYPEQDGYDNDGDGGYVLFEQRDERSQTPDIGGVYDRGGGTPDSVPDWIDNSEVPGVPYTYIPGTLDLDMLDNDFDGFVDERPYQGDPNLPLSPSIGVISSFYRASMSEGADEGAGLYRNGFAPRRYGAGSYEAGVMPFSFYPNRATWDGEYSSGLPTAIAVDTPLSVLFSLQYGIGSGFSVLANPYQGSDGDPADWKAFSERRFYPGDNVIVTLYKGPAINGEVVDRVTYNQYDVINRTIDDIAAVPYSSVDLDASGTAGDNMYELPGINPDYPSMWLPNTMGLDFYRSLERKHPFHNGDRFGTTNRWEATDGNYDDWADSISFFEDELATATVPAGTTPLRISTNRAGNVRPRFLDTHPTFPANPNAFRNRQIFAHAIWGSPLRHNAVARRGANPPDLELLAAGSADPRQFPNIPGFTGPFDYFRTHEMGDYAPATPVRSLPDQRWNLSKMVVANAPYQNPGDLMRVPHMTYLHDAINTLGLPGGSYLRDMTSINYGLRGDLPPANLLSYMQDIALRGATLGQDTVDGAFSPNVLTAAAGSMAQDSLVLTMGQAEFRPILPLAADVTANPDLVNWITNTAGGSGLDDLLAPAAWAPVFLFNLPTDGPRLNVDHFPNYPSYVNGSTGDVGPGGFDRHYLFNGAYLGATGNFGGVDVYNNDPEDRWPLETRTAMYVTESRGGDPAEALFVWDSADGLENGEYIVYIGTYVPGMREQVEQSAVSAARVVDSPVPINMVEKSLPSLLSTGTGPADNSPSGSTSLTLEDFSTLTFQDGSPVPVSRVVSSILSRDPSSERRVNRHFQPVLALEVITDPSEARGQAPAAGGATGTKPPGLIDPNDWNPPVQYRPGPDGYIFYGNNAVGGWKPQIVRVTDNFLALRVRNVGEPGQVAALTHVVLAPRKRTAGRVNVNTAQSRVAEVQTGDQNYYSPLLSLPGVVDVAQTILPSNLPPLPNNFLAPPILPLDEIDLRDAPVPTQNPLTGLYPWTPPERRVLSTIPTAFYDDTFRTPPSRNRFTGDLLNPDNDLLVDDGPFTNEEEHEIGAFRLNAMLMGGRTEHADGRYYTSVGALAADTSAFDFNYDASRADIPDLDGAYTEGVEDFAIYPLSNEANPAKRFDEVKARFSRMGNLVTTRSDVFEIIMTVETGYGVDANLDGFLNYRDPKEFVTRASTKATAVYERRAPSDTSDGAE